MIPLKLKYMFTFLAVSLLCTLSVTSQDVLTYRGNPIPAEIENMYVTGLNFLKRTQSDDGTWKERHGNEPGVVGLAVLAMLAHGENPNFGPYSLTIKKGIDHILSSANEKNGYIGSSMYNHGFATLALAEAYGSVNDPRIGPALKKAVDLILTAQARNPKGGWRYSPEQTNADTTISGAQMVALFAAANAGIPVPGKAIKKGLSFFRHTQSPNGGFGYTSPGSSSPPRSAIGTLVFAIARQKDTRSFKAGYRNLKQTHANNTSYPFYLLYYASQAFFHADMKEWRKWSSANARKLDATQAEEGSWTGPHGKTFSTACSLLSLAVEYRLLPIYER